MIHSSFIDIGKIPRSNLVSCQKETKYQKYILPQEKSTNIQKCLSKSRDRWTHTSVLERAQNPKRKITIKG